MRCCAILFGSLGSLLIPMAPASAQQFVVQEPSLETFGVGTAVSVPDRGRTSLGGVGRSAAARATYGPFRTGHNLGLSSQGSGLSVQAHIHDLAELDRRTLEAAENARRTGDDYRLSPEARHAYETLRSRSIVSNGTRARADAVGAKMPRATEIKDKPVEGPSEEKLLDRARQAEAAGKRNLALAYLRAARDHGSVSAQTEIDRLSREDR